jgi:alpha-tubulin suppressor-like RCC1 family protein
MAVTPVNYTNSNTTLGFSGVDLSNILVRREYFTTAGVYSWGFNTVGQLGEGSTTNRSFPASLTGAGTVYWENVAAGAGWGAAVRFDGTLWTWGINNLGQLGIGSTTNRSSPGTVAGGGTTWDQVACASSFGIAVKNDGSLWTWGNNAIGQLATNNTTARSSPSTIVFAGLPGSGANNDWKYVAAGGFGNIGGYAASIKANGALYLWGNNASGQLGTGATTSRLSPSLVAGGGEWDKIALAPENSPANTHTIAIKTDGSLWSWGGNGNGQLGTGDTSPRSSPGSLIAPANGYKWKDVSCGIYCSAAVKTDGTLWTWGKNSAGVLGDNTTTNRSSPGTVAGGGTTWRQVYVTGNCASAIKTDGTLWSWGNNAIGVLGDGTSFNRSSPGTVIGTAATSTGTTWKQIAVGDSPTGNQAFMLGLVENETTFPQISTYVVPGTFTETIPQGMTSAFFEVWGGGGPGGDGDSDGSTTASGGGGGSGGYSRTLANAKFQVGKTISVKVGLLGVAQIDPAGANSNVSSGTFIVTTMEAGGGSKGNDASLGGPGVGGSGGLASGGTEINTTGSTGTAGVTFTGIGSGGGAGALGVAGRNTIRYGAGGLGGSADVSPGVYAGLNGANGAVIITYF